MAVAVLTRDRADVSAYASALASLGLTVVPMPVTKTVGAADPGTLARALDTGEYAAIMVTSARAADELGRAASSLATVRATMPDLPDVWAVGAATRVALEAARLPAHQPEGVRDGVELAHALVAAKQLRGKRVLVPRAEDGRTEPLEILRAAGADVVDVIAYRTVALPTDDVALSEVLLEQRIDQSEPFVLGTWSPARGSSEIACRSALAVALKMASATWWLFVP